MRVVMTWFASRRTQCRLRVMTSIGYSPLGFPRGKTWTYNGSRKIRGTHAVEFSKTVAPLLRGISPRRRAERSALRYGPTRLAPSALPGEPVQDHRVGRRRI